MRLFRRRKSLNKFLLSGTFGIRDQNGKIQRVYHTGKAGVALVRANITLEGVAKKTAGAEACFGYIRSRLEQK